MRKRLILKMGIKVLLCSSVFSKKNPIFWGPYFLDNLMIKSTEGKIACEKVPSLLTEWLLESLFLSSRCKIIVQVQYWKLVTRLCSLCSSISPWIPFRDQATVKKMNEEVATAFIVRKMVVGRQSVRCILTKMFPPFHPKIRQYSFAWYSGHVTFKRIVFEWLK